MRALILNEPADIADKPLKLNQQPTPSPGPDEIRIRVQACGLCHTDLHTVEGDIQPPKRPVIPGHQIVGEVDAVGDRVQAWEIGDSAGVPWLYSACGACEFCARGQENLCDSALFTGFHRHGGYAEWIIARADYTLQIPSGMQPEQAAPLLCAGIIGYRSLRLADVNPGERIGLVGFGASAHLAIQVALHWECEVYVFTRNPSHRELAQELGASWVGGSEDDTPAKLDRAVLFAPAGELVPATLQKLRRGGTLAINAIHMSPIPEMAYDTIYGERTLRSVSNATYKDGVAFLELASMIPIQTRITRFPLEAANEALLALKQSEIAGAGVLIP